jgi:hypothetical protein
MARTAAAPELEPLSMPQKKPVAPFCPFVDIASLAMRPHSETLQRAARPINDRPVRYLIYSQALTRNSVPRTTGPVLAMHNSGDTAENRGRVLPSDRAGSFSVALSEHSLWSLVFLGGVTIQCARIESAEPFEAFSAANCSAAVVPPRRLEHHAINVVQF